MRSHGILAVLASLLFCACGAGDEEPSSISDPAASEDRASDQTESTLSTEATGELDAYGQAAEALSCRAACTVLSNTNIAGTCCVCNGVQGTYRKSPVNAKLYLCM